MVECNHSFQLSNSGLFAGHASWQYGLCWTPLMKHQGMDTSQCWLNRGCLDTNALQLGTRWRVAPSRMVVLMSTCDGSIWRIAQIVSSTTTTTAIPSPQHHENLWPQAIYHALNIPLPHTVGQSIAVTCTFFGRHVKSKGAGGHTACADKPLSQWHVLSSYHPTALHYCDQQ